MRGYTTALDANIDLVKAIRAQYRSVRASLGRLIAFADIHRRCTAVENQEKQPLNVG